MAEALKEQYSPSFIDRLGTAIAAVTPTFDVATFRDACLTPDWPTLKLMARSDRIAAAMHAQLPADFQTAAPILRAIGPQFTGLVAVCLPNYVAKYGTDDWEDAMQTLAVLTQYSSAEFAIRPFILRYPEQTAAQMLTWSQSSSVDVRRLASEGMRPRLPWGIRLQPYVVDPTPIWPILNRLITDDAEYVQKSVANNLNDISKDHPDDVIAFAQAHWGQGPRTNWVLTRGLRTLFKQGNPTVLTLLGYDPAAAQWVRAVRLVGDTATVALGETLTLDYQLSNADSETLPLYLGYRVHYVRQNKTDAFKDFFLKRLQLKAGADFSGRFKVKWQPLTTRKLYPGTHTVDLLVNTTVVASVPVELKPTKN